MVQYFQMCYFQTGHFVCCVIGRYQKNMFAFLCFLWWKQRFPVSAVNIESWGADRPNSCWSINRAGVRSEMIKFVLMVNRQGQTRLSRYYQAVELSRRAQLEADVVRCCLGRRKEQVGSRKEQVRGRWGTGRSRTGTWTCAFTAPSVPSWSTRTSDWCPVSTRRSTSWSESHTVRWERFPLNIFIHCWK